MGLGGIGGDTERTETRVTAKIVASLEEGVRPWMKPWSGENAAGRISRPLRHNGTAYSGINILMLWGASVEQGFNSPSWMTFRQAFALNAHARKGEKGTLVVYANTFTRTEEDADGQEVDREMPFLKGYTLW
jgi:antirestriction protein ArdC